MIKDVLWYFYKRYWHCKIRKVKG